MASVLPSLLDRETLIDMIAELGNEAFNSDDLLARYREVLEEFVLDNEEDLREDILGRMGLDDSDDDYDSD